MKIRRILSGLLAVVMIAGSVIVPEALPLGNAVITAEAASSVMTPTGFSASATTGKVKLSWDSLIDGDGVVVYRATSKDGKYKSVKTVSGSKTSVTLSVDEGKSYYFKLRAYKKSGGKKKYSDYTAAVFAADLKTQLKTLKKKAPLYAAFYETMSEYPITFSMKMEMDLSSLMGSDAKFELNTKATFESVKKFAMSVEMSDEKMDVVVKNYDFYLLDRKNKTATKSTLKKSDLDELSNGIISGMGITDFDPAAAKYKTGTKKLNGKEYLYEEITIDAGSMRIYADKKTKKVKYMGSGGMLIEIVDYSHTFDSSMMKIPSDYKIVEESSSVLPVGGLF